MIQLSKVKVVDEGEHYRVESEPYVFARIKKPLTKNDLDNYIPTPGSVKWYATFLLPRETERVMVFAVTQINMGLYERKRS